MMTEMKQYKLLLLLLLSLYIITGIDNIDKHIYSVMITNYELEWRFNMQLISMFKRMRNIVCVCFC